MIESKFIFITLLLIAFCICNGMGGPVADPDPDVKVDVKIIVDDNGGSQGGSSGGSAEGSSGNGGSQECSEGSHSRASHIQGHCNKNCDCNKDCYNWCYPSKNWPYTCPGYCGGRMQSPIDICTGSAKNEIGALTFSTSYSKPIARIKIKNNGHTVVASWADDEPTRTISGGGLTGHYTLAQFHFHWGCRDNRGSEHVVDGTRYAMELHFVHFKSIYANLSEAVQSKDGLAVAVLGIFFNVGANNAALEPITTMLSSVVKPSETGIDIAFGKALIDFIPTTRTFYRYQGSLTTPTCNEVVIWSVFSSYLTFSDPQANAFRMLKDKHGCQLCDNYRGIQPLNGRQVSNYQ